MKIEYKILIGTGLFAGVVASVVLLQRQKSVKAIAFYKEMEKLLDVKSSNEYGQDFLDSLKDKGILLTNTEAKEVATIINDQYYWLYIDQDRIFAQLHRLKSKAQVSQVSEAMIDIKGVTLDSRLKGLYKDDYKTAKEIISSKPDIYK